MIPKNIKKMEQTYTEADKKRTKATPRKKTIEKSKYDSNGTPVLTNPELDDVNLFNSQNEYL